MKKPTVKTVKVPVNSGYYGAPVEQKERNKEYYDPVYYNEYVDNSQATLQKLFNNHELRKFSVWRESDFEKHGYTLEDLRTFKSYSFLNGDESKEEHLIYEVACEWENSSKNENKTEKADGQEDTKDAEDAKKGKGTKAGKKKGKYYLKTGLYVGYINIKNGKNTYHIEINSGHDDIFLQRMMNVADNVYLDNISGGTKKSQDMFSNIMGFIFLKSLKAAYAMGIPTEYKIIHEHGYNVKGKFDIKKYVNKDMFMGDKLSYSYKQREYVQDIIDVLYVAMKALSEKSFNMTDYDKYFRELKQMYSGNKVTQKTINNARRHRSLDNPMYSRYKKALRYAELVIRAKNVIHEDDSQDGFSGFLLDISQLWEVYLANLLKRRFGKDYDIVTQEELDLYKGTFYSRKNRPDIVIKKDGVPVAVLDAKYRTIKKFEGYVVKREHMFQINSYSGYYNELNRINGNEPLRFSSLVYPAKAEPLDNINTDTAIYGIDETLYNNDIKQQTRFSVQYIAVKHYDDGEDSKNTENESNSKITFDDIEKAEEKFLDRIQELLEPKQETVSNNSQTTADEDSGDQNIQDFVYAVAENVK